MATTSYTYEEMLKQIEAAMANPEHISYQGPTWKPGGSMSDPIPPWQDPNAPQYGEGQFAQNNFLPGTDVSRVPGFYNPDNPFDTGRSGEKNPERARASGDEQFEDVPWWDYDAQRPKDPNIKIDPRTGYYNPAGWTGGGGSTAQTGGGGAPAGGWGAESFMPPTSGAELGAAGAPPGMAPQQFSAGGPTAWAAQQDQGGVAAPPGLKRNVQLPQHPLGAFSDAKYEAETAMLKADISRAYQDILSQLGYVDPETGGVTKGTVEIEGERKQRELERGSGLAGEEVTKQKQQQGTLFSGIRATDTARAQHPFIEGIANLGVDIPRQLWSLYGKATGTLDDYSRRQNMLIAEAAERASERARLSARATGGGGGSWSGGGGQGTEGPNDVEPPLGWGVLGAGGTTSADDMAKWAAAAGFGWDPESGDWQPVSSGIRGSEAYPIGGPYIGTGVSGQGRP